VRAVFTSTDTNYDGSEATNASALLVNKAATSVGSVTASTSTFGGTTNLSATVAPAGVTGSVAFYINGSATAVPGTYVSATGVATVTGYTHGLNASATAYSVRAVFTSTNTNYDGSEATNASALLVNQASTTLLYNGAFVAVIGNSLTLTATLSSSVAACKTGQLLAFSFSDDNPTTITPTNDGPYSLGSATTNSTGVATLVVPATTTATWNDGVYTVRVDYSSTPNPNCAASWDDASLTAAAPGDSATGGGWYTQNGRLNFGFTVRKVPNVLPLQYKGQVLIHNNGKWRFKGSLTSYVLGTSGATAGLGTAGGTGDLFKWNSLLNGGTGGWELVAPGIGISISFRDNSQGGGKKTPSPDSFGVTINYSFPGGSPNSALTDLKGGDITIH
jgi:hypothetical protein